MCEVFFLYFFIMKIGDYAEHKGYGPWLFRVLLVGLWLPAEGLGWYIATTRISGEASGLFGFWVTGFLAGLVCGSLVFLVLALLPNRGTHMRTGAFGDYRDHLEPVKAPRQRKRRRRSEDDPRRQSFDV